MARNSHKHEATTTSTTPVSLMHTYGVKGPNDTEAVFQGVVTKPKEATNTEGHDELHIYTYLLS